MMTASEAIVTAIGFLGFGTLGLGASRATAAIEPARTVGTGQHAPDPLSAGEPVFEAVAEALRRSGYLDSAAA